MRVSEPDPSDLDLVVAGWRSGWVIGGCAGCASGPIGRPLRAGRRNRRAGGDRGSSGNFFQSRAPRFVFLGPCVSAVAGSRRTIYRTGSEPREEPAASATGQTYPLPRGLVSLAGSRLFSLREKGRLIRFLATLAGLDSHSVRRRFSVGVGDAGDRDSGDGARFVLALFRVSTYVDDAERLSAGAAIEQLKLALKGNVWYIDGGWQTLADGLRKRAVEVGCGDPHRDSRRLASRGPRRGDR